MGFASERPYWNPILQATGAQMQENRLDPPVPITARIAWADGGVENVDTVALGWTGRDVHVRLPDRRYHFTAVSLEASDVMRR